jgi:hypothetical protein
VERDPGDQLNKTYAAALSVELLASDDVCHKAVSEVDALTTAGDEHVRAAAPYVEGKPVDDNYREIVLTQDEINALAQTFRDFTNSARSDLSDPTVRKPAGNCP